MSTDIGSGSRHSINVGKQERNASMAGGASLVLAGLKKLRQRKTIPGLAMLLTGGLLFYRGKTGHCDMYSAIGVNTAGSGDDALVINETISIMRSTQDVYNFWRNLENLPRFMRHLKNVTITGEKTSHWIAEAPGGITAEWDAQMTEDLPGQRIGWRSEENSIIFNEGKVEFLEAPAGRGMELKFMVLYRPPAGTVGKLAARSVLKLNAWQIKEDLKRLKQILETGEEATNRRF